MFLLSRRITTAHSTSFLQVNSAGLAVFCDLPDYWQPQSSSLSKFSTIRILASRTGSFFVTYTPVSLHGPNVKLKSDAMEASIKITDADIPKPFQCFLTYLNKPILFPTKMRRMITHSAGRIMQEDATRLTSYPNIIFLFPVKGCVWIIMLDPFLSRTQISTG